MIRIAIFILCFALGHGVSSRGIILMIGDGMGAEHIKAANLMAHGADGQFAFEALPVHGQVSTHSLSAPITDSAAAATAMATGVKVDNDVLSLRLAGDGQPLETILESAQKAGWSTGLITSSFITDATPAAFGAHTPNRHDIAKIAQDYFQLTRPNILMGGGGRGVSTEAARQAGYTVITNRAEMQALDAATTLTQIAAFFGIQQMPYEADGLGDNPHLHEMAAFGLNKLVSDPEGFFVLIEGGNIDHAAHSNDLTRNVAETIEFAATAQCVLDWIKEHPDTLLIVTADHETGGLKVTQPNGKGNLPTATWSTNWHTGQPVPLFAAGPGSEALTGNIDNTQIHTVMRDYLTKP